MWGASRITPQLDLAADKNCSSPSLSTTSYRLSAIGGTHDFPISRNVVAVLIRLALVSFSRSDSDFVGKQLIRFFLVIALTFVGNK